jgi:hypothetical protein
VWNNSVLYFGETSMQISNPLQLVLEAARKMNPTVTNYGVVKKKLSATQDKLGNNINVIQEEIKNHIS